VQKAIIGRFRQRNRETKASTLLQFLDGLRGDVRVVFEEGTWATWLYDLVKPHVTEVLVCNTRKNAVRNGSKSDRIDARKLAKGITTSFNLSEEKRGSAKHRLSQGLGYRSAMLTGSYACFLFLFCRDAAL
jgi:hypothetical protein